MAIFRKYNQIQTLIDLERRKFGLVFGPTFPSLETEIGFVWRKRGASPRKGNYVLDKYFADGRLSAAELPGLVNWVALPRSDSLLDHMANRKCRPTTGGRKRRPYHWRCSIGRGGSPAWTPLTSVEVAKAGPAANTPRQSRRNHNHRDHDAEKQRLHGALLVPAGPGSRARCD
jgi:hypothetical protein